MSDLVQIAIITAAPGLLLALGSLVKMFRVETKIEHLTSEVNGKMAQLLKVTGAAREAEGKLKGAAEEREKGV